MTPFFGYFPKGNPLEQPAGVLTLSTPVPQSFGPWSCIYQIPHANIFRIFPPYFRIQTKILLILARASSIVIGIGIGIAPITITTIIIRTFSSSSFHFFFFFCQLNRPVYHGYGSWRPFISGAPSTA